MTYCVGALVEAGLVLIADTRTNAGIDNISMYKKLHVLAADGERQVVCASSGSLSVTQSMLAQLKEGLPANEEGGVPRTIAGQPSMFRVAQLVGEALRIARLAVAEAVIGSRVTASASLLLGGRIGAGPLQLFLVYQEGNFIECQPDAPFLQIGELKYGKPILDRALSWTSPLDEVVKIALLSFDSTMRSNLSVGRPLDLIAIPADRARPVVRRRIEEDDPYFDELSAEWSRLLKEAGAAILDPPFMQGEGAAPPTSLDKPLADKLAPVPRAA